MNIDGTVIMWKSDEDMGFIRAHDGRKYHFTRRNWASKGYEPREGLIVTFELSGTVPLSIKIVGMMPDPNTWKN